MNQAGITGSWKDAAEVPGEDRERIRLAILAQILGEEDHRGKVSVETTRELARIDGRKATKVVRDWKRGDAPDLRVSWAGVNQSPAAAPSAVTKKPAEDESCEGGAGLEDLAKLAADATTHEKRDEVLRRLAGAALTGAVKPADADKIRQLLGEMRLQDKDRRTVPQEDPERVYLLSQDGARLVSAFERIVSDERRARAMAAVANLLEEDAREMPAVDPVGRL
jgi:hypothetical protein